MRLKEILDEKGFPPRLVEIYTKRGIDELYPPQEEALRSGVLEGKNLLMAVPTASGKTLIAELTMINSIMKGGKSLYIVPLKALAYEKYEEFSKFEDVGVKVGVSTGDFDSRDEWLGECDIVIATSEKVDSLVRNEAPWIQSITCVVVDEVHLLESPSRGPTLEVTITKLRKQISNLQVVALSATVKNAEDIANWLDAECVVSEWRPVPLKEGVFLGGTQGGTITFRDGRKREVGINGEPIVSLVLDTVKEGGQCIVFESTRQNAEAMAKKVGIVLKETLTTEQVESLREIADDVLSTSDTEIVRKLCECVKKGVAFHHAGLDFVQRRIVEKGFRDGILKCITSTPTLAAGLNLPARRVIIRGVKRYDTAYGSVPIPILEYKQMAGRAGRPHLDPYGEAVLVARSPQDADFLMERYVIGEPEEIRSKLSSESALRTHVLSLVASGDAKSLDDIIDFFERTFYALKQGTWSLTFFINSVLNFLIKADMVMRDEDDEIEATPLGKLVSRLYIDPLSAHRIVSSIAHAEEATPITLLHIICSTPDMKTLYLRSKDFEKVENFLWQHEREFFAIPPSETADYDLFLREVKTTLLLFKWIEEEPENMICSEFGIGPGDIRAVVESARWLSHAMSEIARLLSLDVVHTAKSLERRLEHGVREELLPLVSVRDIGRHRARKLFNAGFRTPKDIIEAPVHEVEDILGRGVAMRVLKNLGVLDVVSKSDDNVKYKGQRSVFEF
ncbi:extensin [Methanosarcinales archaeon]|nr:MAG: extensin [Methanosarcinales archaeon]